MILSMQSLQGLRNMDPPGASSPPTIGGKHKIVKTGDLVRGKSDVERNHDFYSLNIVLK